MKYAFDCLMMKKSKKTSPREQVLSPTRQERIENGRGSALAEKHSDSADHQRRRYHHKYQDSEYGYSGAISPAESLNSLHDAQFYNERIRCLESEKLSIMIEHNNLMKEFNRMMESHMEEVRNLKEANVHFEQEVNDLRDLSVFLDDDRRKCRRLAKEWQRFGRHTVSVMRSEVAGYQEKVRSLENKQTELIKENGELRDLCVYLDNQRSGSNVDGGVDGEIHGPLTYFVCQECSRMKKSDGESSKPDTFKNDHSTNQVLDLQNQILQLEKEKDSLHKLLMFGGKSRREKKRVSFSVPTDEEYDSSSTTSEVDRLEFPPSFGGSNDNFNTIMESTTSAGILRNGLFPHLAVPRSKFPNISPRNNDLIRRDSADSTSSLSLLNADEVKEIRNKLTRSTIGEASLSESEIDIMKRMCHIATEKIRSDSTASNNSLSNSFDQSPLSAPPPVNGLPLYGVPPPTKNEQPEPQKDDKEETVETPDTERVPLPSYDEMIQRGTDGSDHTAPNNENKTEEEGKIAGT